MAEDYQTHETTDHSIIKEWVTSRGGKPAVVRNTEGNGDVGLLRINFPGYSGAESLQDISWEAFFKEFDEKHLVFLYQNNTEDGGMSRFCKFVYPQDIHQ